MGGAPVDFSESQRGRFVVVLLVALETWLPM